MVPVFLGLFQRESEVKKVAFPGYWKSALKYHDKTGFRSFTDLA